MLSQYKIIGGIGSGGFGVVHLAEDGKLKRKVAIKFLSEESLGKEHMRARFQREARMAASLNHPNICTVHEVGEAAPGDEMVLGGNPRVEPGTPFIVMEVVEGQPLDEVMKESGPMPLAKLLGIAVQVADGLAEAHSKSIVHRDLKPKNVMISPAGRAKILDFGMAKPLHPTDDDDELLKVTHESSIELTREGTVLGTVFYMSPEQATGKPVDSRSDVFSFGVMLYEMATSRKPFDGDSVTSTLAQILATEPDPLVDLRADLPHELSRIIQRCLRKNREGRYNDTRDLAVTLKDLFRDSSSGSVTRIDAPAATSGQLPRATPKSGSRLVIRAAGAAALILGGLAIGLFVPRLMQPAGSFVAPSFRQITFTGSASYPTVSPDGQSLAYATARPEGGYQVVIQDLGGGQQLTIFEAAWIRSLRWSPSGSELLVSAGATDDVSQTYLVSRLGGSTRPLRFLPFVAWAPQGDRFAGATLSGKQIWFTETSTGDTSSIELTGTFSFIYEVDWSSDGGLLAFRTSDESERHAIWTTTVDGASQQEVVESATALYSPRFSPRGDVVYYLSGVEQAKELYKIAIDPGTGKAGGEPVLLLSGLQAGDQMTLSDDGGRLFYAREASHTNLWMVNVQREGVTTSPLTRGTFRHDAPRFSPDGTRLALTRKDRSTSNVFVMSLDDKQPRQLTFLSEHVWQPVWSSDGGEIAFGSTMGDAPRVWKIGTRGGTPTPFTNSQLSQDLAWGPGSDILYQRPGDSAFHLISESRDETPLMDDSGGDATDPLQFFSWMASPEYSPDGQRVAISCNCPGGEGVWVVSLRGSSQKRIYGDSDTRPVGWSADGAWVYALKPGTLDLLRIPTAGGEAETYVELPFERVGDVDVTPDGSRVVVAVPVTQADIWQIENFDPVGR